MKRIVVDAETREKLYHFITPLELCDESGQVVARVIPSTPFNDPDNWKWAADITQESLPSDPTEPKFTTDELIERIKGM